MTSTTYLFQKITCLVCAVIFLLLAPPPALAAGPPPQEAPTELESVTLQLRWFHQFQFAGYYAAQAQGYYRDAGLKVNIVEGDPAVVVNTYEEVLAGRAQYGASNTEVLLQRMAGKPLVVLAAIFQHSPYVMIAPQSSGITNPQDLAGRRINMLLGPRTAEMQATLIREGISLEQVTIVSTPGDFPDYLFDESFDAFGVYETNEPFYLEQANIPFTLIRPQTYGIDFYGDVLFTSQAELADHPDRVRRFREASLKGWQYAMDHPDEIIDLILTEYGSAKSREHLQYEAEQMRGVILPDLVELGHMNPGRWERIADIYAELGMAPPTYNLDGFIYELQLEPDLSWVYWVLGITGGLLLLAGLATLIMWIFNRQLRADVAQRTKELEQSQTALGQSEVRYRAVWEISADAMALSDPNGVVVDANPAYLELYGYSSAEVVDHSFAVIFPEAQRDWAVEQYKAVFANPEVPPAFESRIQRSDGTERAVESRIGFIESNGQRRFMLSSVRDITERKNAEIALRRYKQIVWTSPDFVSMIDKDYVYRIVNRSYIERAGKSRHEMIDHPMAELMGEEVFHSLVKPKLDRCLAGEIVRYQHWFDFPDRRRGFMDVNYFPFKEEDGAVSGVVVSNRDITELKLAQIALQESEAKNQALLEAIPDLMFRLTRDGEIIDFRANRTEDLALESAQVIGSRLYDTMPPQVYSLIMARIEQALKSGQMQIFEYQLPVQRGLQDFEARLSVSGDDDVLAIVRNITELKLAQQSLRESEANLRALIENTDGVIWAIDHDYRLVAANVLFYNNMRSAFGRQLQPGDPLMTDDFPADAVAQWRTYYDRALRGERFSVEHETRHLASKQYFEYWFSPIQTTEGEVTGATIYGRDITARKQAEEALQASEERYRHLFEDALDVILITDDEQLFVEANPAACALLGYSRGELLEMGAPDIVPEVAWEATRQLGQSLRQMGQQAGEFTLQRKDGSLVETEYRAVADFLPGLNMVFFRDISARKAYEKSLKTALKEKEILLQELYHRTKNNMQVIQSMLMLQMAYTPDEHVKQMFGEIANKIRTMALVHEKLYMSDDLSNIDLREYINDLVTLLVRSYGVQRRIAVTLELEPVSVLIDTAIPCGLLLNELITNAIKYAFPEDRSGTIKIWLKRKPEQILVLGVSDDGIGVPPDFDPAHSSGLGMQIIMGLAKQQLRGDVTFTGKNGVTFELQFQDTLYTVRL